MTIHFAARIEQTPHTSTETMYVALCGYVGYAAEMFTDIHGKVKKSLGGCVTCVMCRNKAGWGEEVRE